MLRNPHEVAANKDVDEGFRQELDSADQWLLGLRLHLDVVRVANVITSSHTHTKDQEQDVYDCEVLGL